MLCLSISALFFLYKSLLNNDSLCVNTKCFLYYSILCTRINITTSILITHSTDNPNTISLILSGILNCNFKPFDPLHNTKHELKTMQLTLWIFFCIFPCVLLLCCFRAHWTDLYKVGKSYKHVQIDF